MARNNNFDGLRLIAALLVLFSHMSALSGRWEPRFFGDHSFGNLGVLIFFSISGYLITASWMNDPNLGHFLAKRYLQMAPALAVSIPATYSVVAVLGLSGFPGNPLHQLNGSLWTMSLEVYCYLLLVGAAMLTPYPALLSAGGMLAAHCCLPSSFLSYFGLFFSAGAVLRAYPVLQSGRALGAGLIAAILLRHDTRLALAMIVPTGAIYVGTRTWPVLRSAARYGDLSYGIYVYAWPVQQIVAAMMGRKMGYFTLLVPSLLASVGLAWLSWRFVEAPALARKPAVGGKSCDQKTKIDPTGTAAQSIRDEHFIVPQMEPINQGNSVPQFAKGSGI